MRMGINPLTGMPEFLDETIVIKGRGGGIPGGGPSVDPYAGVITLGTNGITHFRMQSPDDGSLWDLYIDATGAVVTSASSSTAGAMIATGPMFGLTYAS